MITFSVFKDKWNTMPIFGHGYLRIDEQHPLEINIGYEEVNQKTLLILNSGIVPNLPSSKSILANNYQLQDGKWVISFRLIRIDNEEVFLRLCWDIIESSRDVKENKINFIIERYLKWYRLLQYQWPDKLSVSRQKGLLGELYYLKYCINNYEVDKAVNSWCGPEGADQDFVFDNTWIEVKSLAVSSENVTISSLEQLDVDKEGYLYIFFIDKTTNEDNSGFTLKAIVDEIRRLISAETKVKEFFETKLFMYGYKDLIDYDKQKYKVHRSNKYLVTDKFPKLVKNIIPPEIVHAKYSISLSSIEKYKK